ncbi:MAG: hypothetical protein ACOX0B_00030 [Minisyncoccales bacterium]|jgi:hypothetical protein
MKSVLEKTKASGGIVIIDNKGLFPGVFEKKIRCRVGEVDNSSAMLIPIGKRGRPTRVLFENFSALSAK